MDRNFVAYGSNIMVKPAKKDSVLSDNANAPKFWLYGEVVSVGSEVKNIVVGDTVGYDKFGIKDIDMEGQKYFFIEDNSQFILGLIKKNG